MVVVRVMTVDAVLGGCRGVGVDEADSGLTSKTRGRRVELLTPQCNACHDDALL